MHEIKEYGAKPQEALPWGWQTNLNGSGLYWWLGPPITIRIAWNASFGQEQSSFLFVRWRGWNCNHVSDTSLGRALWLFLLCFYRVPFITGIGKMGELLFWIVIAGLPVLLACGFAYSRYLKKTGDTTSEEDGTWSKISLTTHSLWTVGWMIVLFTHPGRWPYCILSDASMSPRPYYRNLWVNLELLRSANV